MIRQINGGGSVACPSCGACGEIYEWWRGDMNFDGFVDMTDEDIVDGLDDLIDGAMRSPYRCYQGALGCVPPGACP